MGKVLAASLPEEHPYISGESGDGPCLLKKQDVNLAGSAARG
jgi:hypothetical protein